MINEGVNQNMPVIIFLRDKTNDLPQTMILKLSKTGVDWPITQMEQLWYKMIKRRKARLICNT